MLNGAVAFGWRVCILPHPLERARDPRHRLLMQHLHRRLDDDPWRAEPAVHTHTHGAVVPRVDTVATHAVGTEIRGLVPGRVGKAVELSLVCSSSSAFTAQCDDREIRDGQAAESLYRSIPVLGMPSSRAAQAELTLQL